MTNPLRVGVIGLGPRWHKLYRPALRRLRTHVTVSAVCDQSHARATRVAQHLGCAGADGPTDLLMRKDVDALLLLDAQWHGLWAAEQACRAGKPVLCCPFEGITRVEVEGLRRAAEAGAVPVLFALPLRALPTLARLRALLAERLGPARLVLASAGIGLSLFELADGCGTLFDTAPLRVTPVVTPALSSLVLEYAEGRAAQLATYRAFGPLRLEVFAEHGQAVLQGANRLDWTAADGRHTYRPVERISVAPALLEQFRRIVAREETPAPALGEIVRLLEGLLPAPAAH